jgi:hypothetical protein
VLCLALVHARNAHAHTYTLSHTHTHTHTHTRPGAPPRRERGAPPRAHAVGGRLCLHGARWLAAGQGQGREARGGGRPQGACGALLGGGRIVSCRALLGGGRRTRAGGGERAQGRGEEARRCVCGAVSCRALLGGGRRAKGGERAARRGHKVCWVVVACCRAVLLLLRHVGVCSHQTSPTPHKLPQGGHLVIRPAPRPPLSPP